MDRALAWLVSALVGIGVGAGSHLLGAGDPLLTAAVVGSYALVVRLSLLHPDTAYEEGTAVWAVGRWSGASIGFLVAAVVLGVGPTLPVAPAVRRNLQVLLFGVGYAMWLLGVAYARAKAASTEDKAFESDSPG